MTDISADLAVSEVADDLACRYDGIFTGEEVEEAVHRARTAMTRTSR